MIVPFTKVTVLKQVDTAIFRLRYFGHCMQCTFCMDSCCQYGCDVTIPERDRILALADELAPYIRPPKDQWFKDEVHEDPDYDSGRFVRTRVIDGACAFLSRDARGCGIHRFALATGRDYHQVKPLVCWLFPVTWDRGLLRPSYDVTDDLACKGAGPTLYEMSREEIRVRFGDGVVAELDEIRDRLAGAAVPSAA